jgi:two-component system chemotaxis response regulator CheB
MMPSDGSDGAASGFICPTCGGALWEQRSEALGFECRIGHAFDAAQLWVEHCAARNRALASAARSLAENAALARRLAAWTREHGNFQAADELENEARAEDGLYQQVSAMAKGLPEPAPPETL